MKAVLLVLIFILSTNLFAEHQYCSEILDIENKICLTSVFDVKPTQFSLGMISIEGKIKKIEKRYKKKKLHKKLAKKVLPSVLGPDNKIYIMDGHHSSYSLMNSNIPSKNKVLFVKIVKDCSKCDLNEFEKFMTTEGRSYLFTTKFTKKSFFELPLGLEGLTDNPYRSLSWLLRENGCFNKVDVNFLEFLWARVLKDELNAQNIYLRESDSNVLNTYFELSCNIVKNDKFKDLPGYVSNL